MSNGLHALLLERREALIARWTERVERVVGAEQATRPELVDQMPHFLDELIAALHPAALPLPGGGTMAEEHGVQRLRLGFNVGEVVREYGILEACILELVQEAGLSIAAGDCAVLAKSVNEGTAQAVTQYVSQRDAELQRQAAEHLGFIAHELRNPLSSARMSFTLLRKRAAGNGPIIDTLDRSLRRVSELIDAALVQSWLKAGAAPRDDEIALRDLFADVKSDAEVEAHAKRIQIAWDIEALTLKADGRLLRSAATNLLRNAIKFSPPRSKVSVCARRAGARIIIEIEDACGGLPPGKADELFAPFSQKSADRTGFGLGLAIARQAVEAHHGTIQVQDRPGIGCVFSIDLPASEPSA